MAEWLARAGRFLWAWLGVFAALAAADPGAAPGSLAPTGAYGLSDSVALDEIDSVARGQIAQIEVDIASRRWDEALQVLREVVDRNGDQVIPVGESLYCSLRSYGHARIAALPPEARVVYRTQVDALAKQWYDEGIANRDPIVLGRVVDELLCSSWGDDAGMVLGEMALARGWYGAARAAWERVSADAADGLRESPGREPLGSGPRVADLPDWFHSSRARRGEGWWTYYPDTDHDLAAVRARLILVSIREGALERAGRELDRFRRLHAHAWGNLGGRRVDYGEELGSLLDAARDGPHEYRRTAWPTFAGAPTRMCRVPPLGYVQSLAWEAPLDLRARVGVAAANGGDDGSFPPDGHGGLWLGCHPVVVDDLLLVNDRTRIRAFNLHTGRPAWGEASATVFEDELPPRVAATQRRGTAGVPRFTMTVHDGWLFARMGEPTTSWSQDGAHHPSSGYLVCVDLAAHGRLVWKVQPDDRSWAFEGSPLADGTNIYVGMRRSDVRPQAHVACFDARTGRLRWRRFVCAAETPGQGRSDEITHNLLTLAEGTLYYNTNLGAVAALSAHRGHVRWIRLYRRDRRGEPAMGSALRDLNPCVYYRGQLLTAPADSDEIFALSAASGEWLWGNALPDDVTDLLGVGGGNLIASGKRLWWLDARHGNVVWCWPENRASGLQPRGRGLLVGAHVYWPTVDSIRILPDQPTSRTREVREAIRLDQLGAQGGNLAAVDGYLLIAGPDKLVGLVNESRPVESSARDMARRRTHPER